jgi:hypothetical protein
MDLYHLAEIFYDIFPVRILYKISYLSKEYNELVRPKLLQYKRIYCKFLPKFADRLYKRLIGNEINYDGWISTIDNPTKMTGKRELGINIIRMYNRQFLQQFLDDNMIAFSGICFWLKKRANFQLSIVHEDSLILYEKVYADDLESVRLKNNQQIFIANIQKPGKNNPLEIGHFFDESRIYMIISTEELTESDINDDIANITIDYNFVYNNIIKFIVNYQYLPLTKYDFNNYDVTINNAVGQYRKKSFIKKINI